MYIFVNKRLLYILFIIFIKFNKQTKTDFSGNKNYRKVGHGDRSALQEQYGIGIKNDYDAAILIRGTDI
jgi:hypothetical protein